MEYITWVDKDIPTFAKKKEKWEGSKTMKFSINKSNFAKSKRPSFTTKTRIEVIQNFRNSPIGKMSVADWINITEDARNYTKLNTQPLVFDLNLDIRHIISWHSIARFITAAANAALYFNAYTKAGKMYPTKTNFAEAQKMGSSAIHNALDMLDFLDGMDKVKEVVTDIMTLQETLGFSIVREHTPDKDGVYQAEPITNKFEYKTYKTRNQIKKDKLERVKTLNARRKQIILNKIKTTFPKHAKTLNDASIRAYNSVQNLFVGSSRVNRSFGSNWDTAEDYFYIMNRGLQTLTHLPPAQQMSLQSILKNQINEHEEKIKQAREAISIIENIVPFDIAKNRGGTAFVEKLKLDAIPKIQPKIMHGIKTKKLPKPTPKQTKKRMKKKLIRNKP